MKIAIQGDPIRWRDIKKALMDFGAEDIFGAEDTPLMKTCDDPKSIYFLGGWSNKTICSDDLTWRKQKNYVIYTIEEFEIEFPHKIGDKVFWCEYPYTITGLVYHDGRMCYTGSTELGGMWVHPECITTYPRIYNQGVPPRKLEKLKYDNIENFSDYSTPTYTDTITVMPALPPNVEIDSDETIHIHIPKGYKVEMEFSKGEIILKKIQTK